MRRVVTGEEIAQLRNPDPFAVPAWRSPVYRTPLAIVAVVHAARLLGRLMRFGFRHPIAVLAAIAGVVMWRVIGWAGLTVLAVGATATPPARQRRPRPGRSSRRCGYTAGGRRRNVCGLAMHGRIMGSSSAVTMVLPWIAGRCGGSLARSPRRPGWGSSGLPASCVIRSCRFSARATCRWRTSASLSGMFLPTSPRRCTGTRSGLR